MQNAMPRTSVVCRSDKNDGLKISPAAARSGAVRGSKPSRCMHNDGRQGKARSQAEVGDTAATVTMPDRNDCPRDETRQRVLDNGTKLAVAGRTHKMKPCAQIAKAALA